MDSKGLFKIKDGENYRLISAPKTFDELKCKLDTKFESFVYKDQDGDDIIFSNQEEYSLLLDIIPEMKKPIKITGISEPLLKAKKSKKTVLKAAPKTNEELNGEVNLRKVAMIGCGLVGSASCFALMQTGLFTEMVLIDVDKNKAEGEALDMSHGLPFRKPMKIYAGTYDDLTDAAIIIVTAGANQKPGETRLDLVKKNVKIHRGINAEFKKRKINGIILIVANPVDILTSVAQKLSGLPPERVFGSGTVLDTARFKYLLGEHLSVDSRSVHAFIIGEHGDSEIAVWSSANVSGINIHQFCEMRGHFAHEEAMIRIGEEVKNSAYKIIEKKHATYYGIAMAVRRICECIIRNEKSILSVSSAMNGQFGITGVCLSMPAIVGAKGVETLVPISLDEKEKAKLVESANTLKKVLDDEFNNQ
jgi:L-lactate dehydrogenase